VRGEQIYNARVQRERLNLFENARGNDRQLQAQRPNNRKKSFSDVYYMLPKKGEGTGSPTNSGLPEKGARSGVLGTDHSQTIPKKKNGKGKLREEKLKKGGTRINLSGWANTFRHREHEVPNIKEMTSEGCQD